MDVISSRGPHDPGPSRYPPGCDHLALVLQGGGALGAYQAGVYQALHEARLWPDSVAGVSIGGINSAIIAGNRPERRLERLREFWDTVTADRGWPWLPEGDDARKIYRAQARTRKSFGSMTRKLSVTSSHQVAQFAGTRSRKKVSVAMLKSLNEA